MWTIAAWCIGILGGAWAAEPAPYELQDVGVRVVLPEADWRGTAWTPKRLEADALRGVAGHLVVWSTPGQATVDPAGLPGFAAEHVRQAEALRGQDAAVRASSVEKRTVGEVARVEVGFRESGRDGLLLGASFPIEGQVLHLALVGLDGSGPALRDTLGRVVDGVVVNRAAAPAELAVSAAGMTATLPVGWHKPVGPEVAVVAETAAKLGVADTAHCWTAVRARAGEEPDVMLTCQDGQHLGVVDELSLADVDTQVRPRIFGSAQVPPAEALALKDRLALLYRPPVGQRALRVVVAPNLEGVARTWALGAPGQEKALEEALEAVYASATFTGEHPVGTADLVKYYLAYRPTSPLVLGPGAALLAGVVLAIRLIARPRDNPLDDVA